MEFSLSRNTFSLRLEGEAASSRSCALKDFQEKLGYFFRDRGLLDEALCHASFSNENGMPLSNERLEFLGDSVLGLLIAKELYDLLPESSEGELSRKKSELVCQRALCIRAEALGLSGVLLYGKSMKGRKLPPSVCADALEAVLGAVFLDGGYDEAKRVVRRWLLSLDEAVPSESVELDAKSRLQALMQAEDEGLPHYEVISVSGPAHSPEFHVRLRVGNIDCVGHGPSRKAAEQSAAELVLKVLNS